MGDTFRNHNNDGYIPEIITMMPNIPEIRTMIPIYKPYTLLYRYLGPFGM